jgi:ferredoxin-NADP reductase
VGNPIKLRSRIASIDDLGSGIYAVTMKTQGRMPRFRPGQFLHLAIDAYDPNGGFWPESRVFSIASCDQTGAITIVYSVKGAYTARMAATLSEGREVWLKMPYGDFVIESKALPGQSIVLIAGGTGLTPFVPYLQKLTATGDVSRTIRLYYGVKEWRVILFPEVLARCVDSSLLDLRLWIENEEDAARESKLGRAVLGRLDIEKIAAECKALGSTVFFLSGPPMMIMSFRDFLIRGGVSAECVQIDEWE